MTLALIKYIIAVGFGAIAPFFRPIHINFHRRDSMGNFFRRMTAFILGIVFTITSLVGGVVGGAYYAYKNVNPIEDIVAPGNGDAADALGDLYGASIEELLNLLYDASQSTDNEYTFAKLIEDYNLDLRALLKMMGVDVSGVDQNSEDWKALEAIPILSVLTGDMQPILDAVKLRSLYMFIPSLMSGKTIDDILSKEAQAKLGDYTIGDLMATDENGELGFITAIKGMKIGALLPSIFDATYDAAKHEYVYSVKEEHASLAVLNILGDANIKGLLDIIMDGSDPVQEIVDGDLSALGRKQISEILGMIAKIAGPETAEKLTAYTRMFGDTTVAELFARNEEGKYEFQYEELVSNIEIGYLLGYEKSEGVWVDKNGEEAKGVLALLANIDIGEVLANSDSTIELVNAVIGDLNIKTIFETISKPDENGKYPIFIERLGTITVSDILAGGTENIGETIKENLKLALEGLTINDAINAFVGEEVQAKIAEIEVIHAILDIELSDLIRDEYKLTEVLGLVRDALDENDVTVGEVADIENAEGLLALIADYKVKNVLDGVILILEGDATLSEIVDAFVGQYTVGDIFGAVFNYEYDAVKDNWGNANGEYAAPALVELFKTSLGDFAKLIDPEVGFGNHDAIDNVNLGDVAYTLLQAIGMGNILVESHQGGKLHYVVSQEIGEFEHMSYVILALGITDILENATNADWWIDQVGEIYLGDILVHLVNNLDILEVNAEYDANNVEWDVEGEYLVNFFTNAMNTSIGGLLEAILSGDSDAILDQVTEILGQTNLGDIAYAALTIAGVEGIIVKEGGAVRAASGRSVSGYAMGEGLEDFDNLAQPILGIVISELIVSAGDIDWWFDQLGGIRIGDFIVYFINNYATDVSVVKNSKGDWRATGNFDAILSNLLNVTLDDIRDENRIANIRRIFGENTVGDLVDPFLSNLPAEITENDLIEAICDVTINEIIDIVQSETVDSLLLGVSDLFDGVAIQAIMELVGLAEPPVSVLEVVYEALISDIIDNAVEGTLVEYLLGLSDNITLAHIIDDFGFIPEDIRNNMFVDSTLELSAKHIIDIINGDAEILDVVTELYEGVELQHIVDLFYQDDLGIAIVDRILETEINAVIEIATSDDIPGALLEEFGDITVREVVESFVELPEIAILDRVVDLTVQDIVDIATAEDIPAELLDKFGDVSVREVVESFVKLPEIAILDRVVDLTVQDIVDIATAEDIPAELLDKFGDVTVREVVESFVELPEIAILDRVVDLTVQDIVDIATAEDIPAELLDKFGDITLEDVVTSFVEVPSHAALDKVLDTSVSDIVEIATSDDIVGALFDQFGDITIGDVVGDLYPAEGNAFLEATYGIGIDDIGEIVAGEDVLTIVEDIYGHVTLDDVASAFFEVPEHEVLDKVLSTSVSDIIDIATAEDVADAFVDHFGDIEIGDVANDFYPTKGNAFLEATYGIGVEEIASILRGEPIITVLENAYEGVNIEHALNAFGVDVDAIPVPALEKVADTEINFLLGLTYSDNPIGELLYELKDIEIGDVAQPFYPTYGNAFLEATYGLGVEDLYNVLTEQDNVFTVLENAYEGVNVEHALNAFGVDVDALGITALDKVADTEINFLIGLAYSDNPVGELLYELGDIEIGDVANNFYPTYGNAFLEATYGLGIEELYNVLTAQENVFTVLENAYEGVNVEHALNAFGVDVDALGITALDKVADTEINFLIGLAYSDNPVGELLHELGDIEIGDVAESFYQSQGNAFLEATYGLGIEELYNVLTAQDNVFTVLENAYEGVNVEHALNAFGVDVDALGITALDKVADTEINFLIGLAYSDNPVGELFAEFGDIEIGDVAESFYQSQGNAFLQATYGIGVEEIGEILSSEDIGASIINILNNAYAGVNVEDALNAFGVVVDDVALLEKLGDTQITWIIGLAESQTIVDDIVKEFGDIEIRDVVEPFIVLPENEIIDRIADLSVQDIVDIATAEDVAQEVLDQFGDITIREVVESFVELPENAILDRLVDLSVQDIVAIVTAEDVAQEVLDQFGDITIDDVVSSFITVPENAVLEKVLDTSVQDIVDIATSDDIAGAIVDQFGDITVRDVVESFVELPENAILDRIVDLSVQDIVDIATAEDIPAELLDQFGDITLDDVVSSFVEVPENAVLEKVLDTSVQDIVDIATAEDVVGEIVDQFGDITIRDVAESFVELPENEILYRLVDVSVQDIVDIATAEDIPAELLDKFGDITLDDVVSSFVDVPENAVLEKVLDTSIEDIVDIATAEDVVGALVDQFGDITIRDVVESFVEVPENEIIDRLVDVSVQDIVDIATAEDIPAELLDKFGDITLDDVVSSFIVVPENAALEKLLDTSVQDIVDIATSDDIAGAIVEEFGDITVRDVVESFVELPENEIIDRLVDLSVQDIVDIATAEDIPAELLDKFGDITLDDVVSSFVDVPENAVLEKVLDTSIEDIVEIATSDDIPGALVDQFGDITVRDVVESFVEVPENEILDRIVDLSVQDIVDIATAEDVVDELLAQFGDITVRDVVESFVEVPENEILDRIVDLSVQDIVDIATAEDVVDELLTQFGDITIREVVESFVEVPANAVLDRIVDLSVQDIVDIATAEDVAQAVLDQFGDITIREVVESFVEVPANVVLDRIVDLSVQDIVDIATAEDVVGEIVELFADITIRDVVESFVEVPANAVLDRIVDLSVQDIVDIATAEDVAQAVLDQFGDITVRDVVESFVEVPANAVLDRIVDLSVQDIVDIATAEDVVDELLAQFGDITVRDVVESFVEVPENVVLDRIVDLSVQDIVDIATAEDVAQAVLDQFGDITIREVVESFVEVPANVVLDRIVDLSVQDIVDIATSDDIPGALVEKFGDITLNDVVSSFVTVPENAALEKVLDTSVEDIVTIATSDDIPGALVEKYGDITIGDIVEDLYPAEGNAFLEATYSIGVQTVVDAIEGDPIAVFEGIYTGVQIADAISAFDVEVPSHAALDKVLDTDIGALIGLADSEDIVSDVIALFEDITIGDVISEFVPTKDNEFMVTTQSLSIGQIYDIATKETAAEIVQAIADVYDGLTVNGILSYFVEVEPESAAINKVLSLDISEVLTELATNNFSLADDGYTLTYVMEVWEATTDTEKAIVFATAGVVGVVMYFAANETLGTIIDSVCGEGATWGGAFDGAISTALGYSLVGEAYENSIGFNGIVSTFLGEGIRETLTTGYPFADTYKYNITLGNLLAAYDQVVITIEEAIGMDIALVEGEYFLDNEFVNITKDILNVSLGEVLDAEDAGKYLVDLISDNNIGDLTAYFFNKVAEDEFTAIRDGITRWIVLGGNAQAAGLVQRTLNVTLEQLFKLNKETAIELAKEILGEATVGDMLAAFGVEDNTDVVAVQQLLDTRLTFAFDVIESEDKLDTVLVEFSDITLGSILNGFYAAEGNAFMNATYSLGVATVKEVVDGADFITVLETAYAGVDLESILNAAGVQDNTEIKLVEKLLDTPVNFFFGLTHTEDVQGYIFTEFNDIEIGDVAEKFLPASGNNFLTATYGLGVAEVEQIINDADVVELLKAAYAGVDVEDVVGAFGVQDTTGIPALSKVLDTELNFFFDLANSEKPVDTLFNEFGDIEIGDVAEAFLLSNGNPFLVATYSFGLAEVKQIVDGADAVEVLEGVYADVVLSDIVDVFGAQVPEIKALDKVLDTEINFFLGLIGNEDVAGALVKEFGDIELGDALETVYPSTGKVFVKLTYTISVEDVANMVSGDVEVLDFVTDLYAGVDLNDVVEAFGVEAPEHALLAKVLDTEINDVIAIATADNVANALFEEFGDIEIGDVAEDLYPAQGNKFLTATYGFGVEEVGKLVNGENAVEVVKAVYEGVELNDVLAAVKVTAPKNDALEKVLDTEINAIIDIATADNVVDAIFAEFGDITLYDALDDIYAAEGNAFLDATYTISVAHIGQVVNGADPIALLEGIYEGVEISDVLDIYGVTNDTDFVVIDKVLDTPINFFLGLTHTNDIADEFFMEFGDIELGDALRNVYPTEGNKFLKATYDFGVAEVEQIVDGANAVEVIKAVYAGVELNDVIGAVGILDTTGNAALADVLDTEVNFFLGLIGNEDVKGELIGEFGDIELGDALETVYPSTGKVFVKLTYTISVEDVANMVSGDVEVLDFVTDLYAGVDLNDVVEAFGVEAPEHALLDKVLDTEINFFLGLIDNNDVVVALVDQFGDITIGDAISEFVPTKGNEFMVTTQNISIAQIYDVATKKPATQLVQEIANIYDGLTINGIVSYFTTVEVESAFVNKVLSFDISELLTELATNNFSLANDGYTLTFAKEAWEATNDTEKAIAIAAVGVVGVVMYFVANDTLGNIVDEICGVGATWGDVFDGAISKALGYSLVGEAYENSIGFNGLVSTFLGEYVRTTLTTGYPFADTYKYEITLGNLLSAYDKVVIAIEEAIGMDIALVEGDLVIANEFVNITRDVLNVSLGEVLDAKDAGKYLVDLISDNNIGDLTAYFFNKVAEGKFTAIRDGITRWIVLGGNAQAAGLVQRTLNVTLEQLFKLNKETAIELAKEILGEATVGDMLAAFGVEDNTDVVAVQQLLDTRLTFAFDVIESEDKLDTVLVEFSDITLGSILNGFYAAEENAFMNATYSLGVATIKEVVDGAKFITVLEAAYAGVDLESILNAAGVQDKTGVKAVEKILDTEVNFFLGLIGNKDVANEFLEEFGDIELGDVLETVYPSTGKLFIKLTYTIGVKDVVTMIKGDAVAFVTDLYTGVELNDVLEAFGVEAPENAALDKVLDTEINFFFGLIDSNNVKSDIYREFIDIELGDAIEQYLPTNRNEFLEATYGIGVEEAGKVLKGESVVAILMDAYEGVDLDDVIRAAGIQDTTGIPVVAKVLDTEINFFLGLIGNNEAGKEIVEEFGDVELGDVLEKVYPSNGKVFLELTYSIGVNDVASIVNNEISVAAFANILYAGVEVKHVLEAFKVTAPKNDALEKVLDTKLTAIIDIATAGSNVVDAIFAEFGDITLYDALDDIYAAEGNAFLDATYTISVDHIGQLVNGADPIALLKGIYEGVEVKHVLDAFNVTAPSHAALDKVLDTKLTAIIDIATPGGNVVDEIFAEFADITVGDVASKYAPAKGNAFMTAVHAINVGQIYSLAAKGTKVDKVQLVANILDQVTVGDVVTYFKPVNTTSEFVNKALSFEFSELLAELIENNFSIAKDGYTVTFAKDAWALTTKTEKAMAIASVGVVGAVMYFAANDTLVKIVDKVCGEGATWGDVFGGKISEVLGYSLVDGAYVNGIGFNGLVSTFLGEGVGETLTKGYPFVETYKDAITLGNLLTAYEKAVTAIEDAIHMDIALVDGNHVIVNEFINLSRVVLNMKLVEVFGQKDIVRYVGRQLADNNIGDVAAYVLNKVANGEFRTVLSASGEWTIVSEHTAAAGVIERAFNVTVRRLAKLNKQTAIELVKEIVGEIQVNEILPIFNVTTPKNAALDKVLDTKIVFILSLANGKNVVDKVLTELSDITLGDGFAELYKPEANKFMNETYTFGVAHVQQLINKADPIELVKGIYQEATLMSLINAFGVVDKTGIAAVGKVLDTKISFLLDLVRSKTRKSDLINAYGEITVGDFIPEGKVQAGNKFVDTTLAITVKDVIKCLEEPTTNDKIVYVANIYDGVTVGDLLKKTANVGDPLKVVYGINIGATISTYIHGGQNAAIRYVLAGVKVGDVATKALTSIKKVNIAVDYNAGEYEVTAKGAVELIERVLNYSVLGLYDDYKDDKDALVASIVGEDLVREIVDLFGQGYRTNPTYTTLTDNIRIIDVYKVINKKMTVKALIGDFTLGSLVTNYLPGKADGRLASGKLVKAILDTKINQLDGLNKTKFFNLYGTYTIGDALSSFMTLGVDGDGKYVYEGTMSKVISKIFNYSLDTFSGGVSAGIDTILSKLYLGDVLGFEEINGTWYNKANLAFAGGETFEGLVPVISVNRVLAGRSLKSLTENFDFNEIVADVKLGELFGYQKNLEESAWYTYAKDSNGYYVVTGPDVYETYAYTLGERVAKLHETLSEITAQELLTGGGVDTLMSKVKGLPLGDVLGYTLNTTDNKWYSGTELVAEPMNSLAHHTINEVSGDFDGIVGGWKVGTVLGYTYDGVQWLNGATPVTGVLAKLSAHTIEDIKTNFSGIINEWTLSDVLGDIDESNHILYALRNTEIQDLSDEINNMKLGTIMGYTYDGTKWMNGSTEVTDSFALILADYTVTEVGNEGFADTLLSKVKDELTISKFITYDADSPLGILYTPEEFNSVKLNEMLTDGSGKSVGDKMKSLNVGKMIALEVVVLTPEQIEMLDDNALVPDDWREMNFTSFFSLIITLALN